MTWKKLAAIPGEQWAKKVVSDSLRLVDFAVEIVDSILNLLVRQVKFLGVKLEKIQITEVDQSRSNYC